MMEYCQPSQGQDCVLTRPEQIERGVAEKGIVAADAKALQGEMMGVTEVVVDEVVVVVG